MSGSENAPLAQRLAEAFSDLVRDALTVEGLVELRDLNQAYEGSSECASHDYLDADVRMSVAFRAVLGRARDDSSAADAELWNTAWLLAKNAQFTRPMALIQNAYGHSAYTYSIRGMGIEDPNMSECGRFRADPARDYGLTPEEVTALIEANARLRAEAGNGVEKAPQLTSAPRGATLSDIRKRYPKLQPWHTGGGCMALLLECPGESYILITDIDAASIPDESATEVSAGWLAGNADPLQEVDISLEALPGWIDKVLQRAGHPQSVGDYFIVKLGEDHYDETLYQLPLNSVCGKNCRKMIDAAVELIGHMRAALGRNGAIIPGTEEILLTPESTVVAITRQVIEVYRRG